jgi:uncharacterized protein YjdB
MGERDMKSKGFILTFCLMIVFLMTTCSLGSNGGSGGGGLPAPVKLSVTETSSTSISLTWTAVSGAAKYKIYFSVTATGQYMYRDETEERSYLVSDLVANQDYYFKVSSVDDIGIEGPPSTYATGKTKGNVVTGVSMNKASTSITVGGTETLIATVTPSNATNSVTWSSSNPSIATVTNGVVIGVAVGNAVITVTTEDGGFTDKCTVDVSAAPIPVIGVYLNKTNISITVGGFETLTATIIPSNATNQNLTWSSSNASIASVSQAGVVTGLSAGMAFITVSTVDGIKFDTCAINVTPPVAVTGVSLSPIALTLDVGGTQTLSASVVPANAANKNVTWTSSHPSIASVTNGVVKGVAEGTATVTVTTIDGGYGGTCTVTVSPVFVTGVSLNKTSTSLLVGGTETLIATVTPSNATKKAVTWTSSNTYVATVSATGVVSGVSVGSADITVATEDGNKTANCTVNVNAAPIAVTGVSLNKLSTSITLGNFETLYPTIMPSNATNQNITWSSSNTGIVTVTNGVVIGVAVGNAVITVTTVDGNKTAACSVTVSPISVTSVTLNKTSISLTFGGTETLIETVSPSNATNKNVTWSSSATSVATVSSTGVVSAVAAGYATITVSTVDGGKTASCFITVSPVSVTGVSLNKTSTSLLAGGTETLIATIIPSNATNQSVTWSSNNTGVATVSSTGMITGVAAGSATITVITVDGGRTATCAVTVTAASVSVTGVTLSKSSTSLTVGGTETLTATIAPANATNQNVTWSSSATGIATVSSSGVVTAVSAGSATITVTTADGGKTATCTFTVTIASVSVTGVTLNKSSTSLTVGGTETLTATVAPANATNKNVTWNSSANGITTVSSSGLVTAVSAGSATITVTTADGGKTASCAVNVDAAPINNSLVRIEGGTFTMGSPSNEPERGSIEVQHQVTLSSFYMGKYQVTQAEYEAVMGTNPSYFKGSNRPVEQVSWYDAVEFCNRLSQQEGLTPAYSGSGSNITCNWSANGYRLPTEAEWEYACRAGTTTPFNTGNNITTSQTNYNGNYPYNNNAKGIYRETTTPVGSFASNSWGLYDMHGNVYEWCWDWYGSYSSGAQTNPRGPVSGAYLIRVIRGGSWYDPGRVLRSAYRYNIDPSHKDISLGFRLARN